jgi:(hydroxyamino)benzene mutase
MTEGNQAMIASTSTTLSRQGHRLLQVGAALLLYSFFVGFAIPYVGSPRIGLSVHTLSALQSMLLLTLGLVWPRLTLGRTSARLAFWFLIYSDVAILAAYTIAAVWGVGIETIALMGELPHGLARGAPFQERLIKVIAYSSASGLIAFALIFWGLRMTVSPADTREKHI